MSTFRRDLSPLLRADSPYKRHDTVVYDYTPPHTYETVAPADEATVPTEHDEYQPGTLRIFRLSDEHQYAEGTNFEEVRPGQWKNIGITEGTPIRIEYLLTDASGDGDVLLQWEGVDIAPYSTWNFTGTGIASIGVHEGKIRFVLEGGGGGGGVVDILGEYDPATTYMTGDVIVYDNALWTVLNDNTTGITPTEGSDYTQIAVMGLDGNTILSGTGAPSGGTGNDGDFYLDITNKMIYGPKASGAWPAGVSIQGPQGIQGPAGSRWYSGAGVPAGSLGAIQDWYLHDTTGDVYEKTGATTWTLRDNLRGPEGTGGGGGGSLSVVQLGTDQTNSTTTLADATGLSFDVEADRTYLFTAYILWDTPSTATAAAFSINGPASPTLLSWHGRTMNSAGGGITTNNQTAYDVAAIGTTAAYTTNNLAMIEGIIKPSVDGTVVVRFRSETAGQQITVKAGSTIKYVSGEHIAPGGPFIEVRGTYDPATFYNMGQAVTYGGTLWVALQDNTVGVTPTEGANWTAIAIQGEPGEDGADGADGINGVDGEDGRTILHGTTAPGSGLGADGDFYINTLTYDLYGPKAGGSWPAPVSLVAPDNEPSVTISSSQTAPVDKHLLLVNASGGSVTITLPTAVGRAGKDYVIKKIDISTNTVVIDGNGSETIDGLASIDTAIEGDAVTIESDGANWWITSAPTHIRS
jgi:hypothetical protein